jgi:tRNA (adenine57-N1/adenine58-N1)-methyltransferase
MTAPLPPPILHPTSPSCTPPHPTPPHPTPPHPTPPHPTPPHPAFPTATLTHSAHHHPPPPRLFHPPAPTPPTHPPPTHTSTPPPLHPAGHVHTFEFHELRCKEAEKEFKEHSLEPFVTIRLRNIEEQGFPEELHGKADGLFLDLPGPWKVVPSAAACLKPDGRFCSFSPCIEQVQRTCLALDEHGFTDIVTYECLLRVHEVWTEQVQTEFETLAKRRRVAQVTEVAEGQQEQQQGQGTEAGISEAAQEQQEQQDGSQQAAAASADAGGAAAALAAGAGSTPSRGKGKQQQQQRQKQQQPHYAQERVVVTKPAMDAKGHTGYLTFARKFVR